MRLAYADPPYMGQAKRHYSHDPNAREVNHRVLVGYLCDAFDGWALSLSTPSLPAILPLCPPEVRVGAWVKPFASFKPGVRRAYAWEPVIFWGGRAGTRDMPTVRDWVAANITLERGLSGAKPPDFCFWVFDFLGAQPGDTLEDVFPGSGAVSRAWDVWLERQRPMAEQFPLFAAGGQP